MAKNKIERIDQEITKVREKIAEYQEKLKALEAQKTEAENLEIVQMVRALRMTPTQLSAMLSGGTVPGSLADDNNEQEENSYEEETIAPNTFRPLPDNGCGIWLYDPCFCTGVRTGSGGTGRGFYQ